MGIRVTKREKTEYGGQLKREADENRRRREDAKRKLNARHGKK